MGLSADTLYEDSLQTLSPDIPYDGSLHGALYRHSLQRLSTRAFCRHILQRLSAGTISRGSPDGSSLQTLLYRHCLQEFFPDALYKGSLQTLHKGSLQKLFPVTLLTGLSTDTFSRRSAKSHCRHSLEGGSPQTHSPETLYKGASADTLQTLCTEALSSACLQ